MTSRDFELEQQLREAGEQLANPPGSSDEPELLLTVLNQLEKLLSKVNQAPPRTMVEALKPSMKALIRPSLSCYGNVDVRVAVAACISEITRITSPNAPYEDDLMTDVFRLIVFSFRGLEDQFSRSYNKRVSILETVSKVRACVIMLDLELDELILKMFGQFLNSVRDYHLGSVFSSMEDIMVTVLVESDEIRVEMLKPLLACVKKDNTGVLPVARKLAEGVFLKSADKLRPYLKPALKSLGESSDMYTKVVTSVCEGTTVTFENDYENTSGLQSGNEIKRENGSVDETPQADESKLTTAPSEHLDQVVKEEASPEEVVDSTVDRSLKSVTSNGVNDAGNAEASVDQVSKKPEEEISQQPGKKADTDDSELSSPSQSNSIQDEKSKQTGKKVDAKGEDSDSDAKRLKTSVKKGERSNATDDNEENSDSDDWFVVPSPSSGYFGRGDF